jgi:hypothetical protein
MADEGGGEFQDVRGAVEMGDEGLRAFMAGS